jgi:hypothetical protein
MPVVGFSFVVIPFGSQDITSMPLLLTSSAVASQNLETKIFVEQ